MGRRNPDSLDFYELPEMSGAFSVSGYSFWNDRWRDVENGAWPLERYGLDRISDVERVTVHYVNPETGQDVYYTVNGPFSDDWDEFLAYVEYNLDPYSEA